MPATLAALGPHKILKLSNLFVEAIDVLVRDQKSIKQSLQSLIASMAVSGKEDRENPLVE